jgi:hypothetical protein
MNPLSIIPSWAYAAIIAALAATSCKLKVDLGSVQLELEKTKVVYEQERAASLAVLANAQERARQAEHDLTRTAATIREETHAQVIASAAVADDLRRRLRAQSANAATAALVSSATTTAAVEAPAALVDGAVIPERVGVGLVGLAERAEETRLELVSCRREYESARTRLEALAP